MKVLVVAGFADSLLNFRGELLKALIGAGAEVHVAAPALQRGTPVATRLEALGCRVHDIPLARTGLNPFSDLRLLWALYRLAAQIRPTHILSYTIKPVLYGTIAAWLAGVGKRTALITGLGYAFDDQGGWRRKGVQVIARSLYRVALSRASTVIFQNPDDRAMLVRLGLVAAHKTALVNGSGVPLGKFATQSMPAVGADGAGVNFLLIARLIRDKGVLEYVEAARQVKARYPAATFHLAGWIDSNPSAISQQALDEWIAEGVVTFHGFLEDVRDVLAACHVYVLPSYREGTPRSVLEAMACGRAIVTTDAPGCRETVIDGRNGFLVPVRDSDALARACMRFLAQPELIARMGRQSRLMAEEKFDADKVNIQMMKHMAVA